MASPEFVLGVFALALRLAIGLPQHVGTGGDQSGYLILGRNLANGHGFSLATSPPYTASDFRMPGYPVLIAMVDWLGTGSNGLKVVNSILGALAVVAVIRIARVVFADSRWIWVSGFAVGLYPTMATYTSVALTENLSVAALCWFVYYAFFAQLNDENRWHWLIAFGISACAVTMARAEGVLVVLAGVILMAFVRRLRFGMAAAALTLALIPPAAWALRNHAVSGRYELSDPMDTYITAVLSVKDGNFQTPLYRQGVQLAQNGAASNPRARAREEHSVRVAISYALSHDTFHVAKYKLKSLADFPFPPLDYSWSAGNAYSLSEAFKSLSLKNALRIIWSIVLLAQYVLAVIGLRVWLKHGRRAWVVGTLLYPVIAFLLAIPFHSELRLWFAASIILVPPAVQGAETLIQRADRKVSRRRAPR
jgi:hypothetical protein